MALDERQRAILDEEREWQDERAKTGPTGAAALDAQLVTVGVSVWQRAPEGSDYDRRGGMVTAVTEKVDEGTGEVVRAFQVLDWTGGRPHLYRLAEADIDVSLLGPPNTASIRSAIVGICAYVGLHCRKGPWTVDRQELVAAAERLGASLGFPR